MKGKQKSRTFQHHITGRTIIRDLNIPSQLIPEYYPTPTREQEAASAANLSAVITAACAPHME